MIAIGIKRLLNFLNQLEESKVFYNLNKVRDDAIMVEISVPGQRWEVEFMENNTVEVEKFISNGDYYDGKELDALFTDFAE